LPAISDSKFNFYDSDLVERIDEIIRAPKNFYQKAVTDAANYLYSIYKKMDYQILDSNV